MNFSCGSTLCQLPPLLASDGRIEIKAVLPAKRSGIKNMCVRWRRNGEAAFHQECWSVLLKMARSRSKGGGKGGSGKPPPIVMSQAEKLMIVNAAKTLEKFDSMEDVKRAAKTAAGLIRNANYCIAFTGAGISTSAGLGDFRGKSGKWTEQDQSRMDGVIQAALQVDMPGTSTSSAEEPLLKLRKKESGDQNKVTVTPKQEPSLNSIKMEPPSDTPSHSMPASTSDAEPLIRKFKSCVEEDSASAPQKVKEEPVDEADGREEEEEAEGTYNYEAVRPTYTHEALALLMERGLLHYVVSQNCDGLHLLSGISPDLISELHGNVFMERCPRCEKRYTRDFYVMHDEASQYYEELEEYGETELAKPKFATQCPLCGLCHRTGRRCEEKGCNGYLEDTVINFRDNLEEVGLDRAWDESGKSDIILCLGTTLMVTPACDIVDEAKEEKPLIICNRQKTAKEDLAKVRVFGDCDVFMSEVLAHLLDKKDKKQWEEKRGERMKKYNLKRQNVSTCKQ